MTTGSTQKNDCTECARIRAAVERALSIIARSAGGTVAEVKRVLTAAVR